MSNAAYRTSEFLKTAQLYRLGSLPTESVHPKTTHLSELANKDLKEGIKVLKEVDLDAMESLKVCAEKLEELRGQIEKVIERGDRVFISGCGATGRLAISLEYLWREKHASTPELAEKVVGFMSGGDHALIRSIENFEDHPEYGARQLEELGFSKNDLLIAVTEGGETPFVIGTAQKAIETSVEEPYFVYCNPDSILVEKVQRSQEVIQNKKIKKICMHVGPMAISGSTRLQACTVQMLGVGLALLDEKPIADGIEDFIRQVKETDFSFLEELVSFEADTYKNNDYVLYQTDRYGITLLTDTTERSPTFSLAPFENLMDQDPSPSLCYIELLHSKDPQTAWEKLLHRPPRPLGWQVPGQDLSLDRLYGFDFSQNVMANRSKTLRSSKQNVIRLVHHSDHIELSGGDSAHRVPIGAMSPLEERLMVKLLLNIQCVLVMGRMGRYHGNVMTWVKPNNGKLIDRSIRYIEFLLQRDGSTPPSYEDIAHALFEEQDKVAQSESVVMKTFHRLKGRE